MTTYRLLNNVFDYKEAFVDFKSMRKNYDGLKVWFNEENESLKTKLKAEWLPVPVEFDASSSAKKKAKDPDLSVWNMSCLVLSEKAHNALNTLLDKHGELFPLDDGYYLFNCLESIRSNAIDGENSAFEIKQVSTTNPQLMGAPKKLVLLNSKIKDKVIFKPGFLNNNFLMCQDEFKAIVDKADLGGLIFSQNLSQMFPTEL